MSHACCHCRSREDEPLDSPVLSRRQSGTPFPGYVHHKRATVWDSRGHLFQDECHIAGRDVGMFKLNSLKVNFILIISATKLTVIDVPNCRRRTSRGRTVWLSPLIMRLSTQEHTTPFPLGSSKKIPASTSMGALAMWCTTRRKRRGWVFWR